MIIRNILLVLVLFVSITNANTDYKKVYEEYKTCIKIYDNCIADFLDTFVNMGGDSVEDCKIERKECEDKAEKLIKEYK